MTTEKLRRLHCMLEILRDLQGQAEQLGFDELDHLLSVASLAAEEKLSPLPYAIVSQEYLQ